MRSSPWHHCSGANLPDSSTQPTAYMQVRASGASRSLGDICMAQLLLGRTAVMPVVPNKWDPTRDGTTVGADQ